MREELEGMSVVGGAVSTFYADVNQSTPLKFVLPAREHFVEGELAQVKFGDIVVAEHKYRQGDFFPLHIPAEAEALKKVQGTQDLFYEITHIDQTTSKSAVVRSKIEVFDSRSSFSQSNVE
ncbi:hypothetical protein [Pseudomonas sp. MWU12-2029]|uniref:hypothetical protein n=1 Tax=Pseudomonas sp. MWU12-2029 TaxID=2927805 RepID=UPI00200CF6D5|nr:hypothetical protein [Pseudomonas sp. MWU12-2029]